MGRLDGGPARPDLDPHPPPGHHWPTSAMLFNSLEFLLLFMPVTLGIALRLRAMPLLGWISGASFVFYAFAGHAWFLIPMIITTLLDYWVGSRIGREERPARRRALLLLSLVGNLGLLTYFKYSGLLLRTASELGAAFGATVPPAWLTLFDVVLPAGISFYTFQTISYVIDIYRRHAHPEPTFLKYIAFVAFFPHLVAGPLTRHNQLIPQLSAIAERGITPRWKAGVLLFSIGLAKKVLIADRIANLIDPIIASLPSHGLLGSWLAILGYSMQIYFDFSGYSDMAVGLGRLFQIELPQNFNSPYKAVDPSDFWRRWHITLSQWLRDYLYISLGGNRGGARRTQLNLLITMVLGGLWHGASWTFAAWGLFHGLLLVIYHRVQPRWDALSMSTRRAAMYLLVCVGWVFFRARDLQQAVTWLGGMAGVRGLGLNADLGLQSLGMLAAALTGCVLLTQLSKNSLEFDLQRVKPLTAGALGVLTAIAILMMNYSSRFLYFQF